MTSWLLECSGVLQTPIFLSTTCVSCSATWDLTSGSHHIFRRAGIEEHINLQRNGSKAKPYQVKQVRAVIVKYGLGGNDAEV